MKYLIKYSESCRTICDNPLHLQKDVLNFPEFEGVAKHIKKRYAA